MNTTIQCDSVRDILKYRQKDMCAFLAGIVFICNSMISGFLRWILPSFSLRELMISFIINGALAVFSLIALYDMRRYKKLQVWPFYAFIFGSIVFSVICHPEYGEWFHHAEYNLSTWFFRLTAPVFGLLFFSLFTDKAKLTTALVWGCRLNVFWHIYEYIDYLRRGFWYSYLGDGTLAELSYGLNYGYRAVFCAVLFWVLFQFNKKPIDLIFSLIAFVLSLVAGSRGPMICVAGGVIFTFVAKWRMSRSFNAKFFFALLALVLGFTLLITGVSILNAAVEGFFDLMRRMDIQSRFIQKLLDGTLSEDSGRSEINRIAFDMIRNGGIFGYGFYGDRYVIGQTWHYGYPHNIFLEWLIEFGPLLGGVFCLLFMFNVVRMGIRVIDPTWTFLWILFISTNMKLIVSDSFWYYWPFWGLLSVLGLWNKENRSSPIPKKGSSIIPVP